jgi:hypothetical protein
MDRLITIRVDYYDRETEVEITRAKSGLPLDQAQIIVDIVRELRKGGLTKQGPSLRASIMIGRVTAQQGGQVRLGDPIFPEICRDVLAGLSAKVVRDGSQELHTIVDEIVTKHLKEARRVPMLVPSVSPKEG